MATFTDAEIRQAARTKTSFKSAQVKLQEDVIALEAMHTSARRYDVFLSHSVHDAAIVLGVKTVLENAGKSVYVDWIEDRQLDRTQVNPKSRIRN